jgi:hypothetical protein
VIDRVNRAAGIVVVGRGHHVELRIAVVSQYGFAERDTFKKIKFEFHIHPFFKKNERF